MQFPVYRKYNGLDTWFKIISEAEFLEVKRIGKQMLRSHIIADKFPEKQFIRDMIECYENRWIEVDAKTAETIFSETES